MDKEKFERYKNAPGIALLNAFKNGELTKDEYKFIQNLKRSGGEMRQASLAETEHVTSEGGGGTEKETRKKGTPGSAKADAKEPERHPAGLILKEGVDGPRTNYTKYPNTIEKLVSHLEPVEEILYYKLWRLSWGYKRNYCRVGYHDLLTTTSIKSRFKVVEGMNGLITKGYVARIAGPDGKVDTTQSGTLYRVFTPDEIVKGTTEEGILLSSIRDSGIPTIGIPPDDTPHTPDVSQSGIPDRSIPPVKPAPDLESKGGILGTGIPESDTQYKEIYKDMYYKDTLSHDELIKNFYRRIGQTKISKKERERAEKIYTILKEEGFSEKEMTFAADWTICHVQEVRSFTILEHTIGQALAEREKALEQRAQEESGKETQRAEREQRQREEEEQAKLDVYLKTISPPDREALEAQAREELRQQQVPMWAITSMALEAKVKELVRKERFRDTLAG
jgi:hypothetical protein